MYNEALKSALSGKGYQDLRYQQLRTTTIKVSKGKIKDVSVVNKAGGNSRALIGGGYGTYSFNDISDAKTAMEQSASISSFIPGSVKLAQVPVTLDEIIANPLLDPRTIDLDDKKSLLLSYDQILCGFEDIVNTDGSYYEIVSYKTFVNNEGSVITQEHIICGINYRIISMRDGVIQQTRLSLGGTDCYSDLLHQELVVHNKAQQTVDLLEAKTLEGGDYDVILDHEVGGLFIHEAFGHLSESDNLLDNEALRETMTLGTEFGSEILNVIDDPSLKGIPGSYTYDDEGVRGKQTYLIKKGKLSGRLHSRQSAGLLEEEPTGHCRAKDYNFKPIVRMGNIYIDKGPHKFEDMISSMEKGILLFGSAGGQTSGEMFTFAVQGGYQIKEGKITNMVRDIALSGNLFTTMKNIEMIADSVEYSKAGGCGKAGQILVTSGKGSAPIKVKKMSIGGK
ncbi:TldD/PmbA family protein [Alkalicella caledoniensis]|uniref:TldD/PmbA family protein n=1 Tax=Alkalicella caledoniensis TaxID=2731377 RepID=A0A7G9WBI2_ALKCA|nr:TldD/PmbA family protein [Alkalicella caledoniensis]QNO16044.1 TldD/PmbA family protein [Alkalicella caledoniensis]